MTEAVERIAYWVRRGDEETAAKIPAAPTLESLGAAAKDHTHSEYAASYHIHSMATVSDAGFMSADDKRKLDGMTAHPAALYDDSGAAVAEVYQPRGSATAFLPAANEGLSLGRDGRRWNAICAKTVTADDVTATNTVRADTVDCNFVNAQHNGATVGSASYPFAEGHFTQLYVGGNPIAPTGVNTVTSLTSLPTDKPLIIASLTIDTIYTPVAVELSLANVPPAGSELHVIVQNNTVNIEIGVALPTASPYVNLGDAMVKIAAGERGEINLVSDGTNVYIRSIGS